LETGSKRERVEPEPVDELLSSEAVYLGSRAKCRCDVVKPEMRVFVCLPGLVRGDDETEVRALNTLHLYMLMLTVPLASRVEPARERFD
jgi:hypothetical protein